MRVLRLGSLCVATLAVLVLSFGPLRAVAQLTGMPDASDSSDRGADTRKSKKQMESGGTWRRTPCDQVISRVDRDENLGSGRLLDISLVAQQLGTSVMWVERCMLAYGRRPARASVEKSTDQRLENLEEQEPEEIGAEEEDATGEKPERPERPKTLHNSQRPAPEPGEGQPQP